MVENILILASGGMDSRVLVAEALALRGRGRVARVELLFFDYGQPAVRHERRAVMELAEREGLRHMWLPLSIPSMGAMLAPKGQEGPRVIPWRNLIFIAHAANVAVVDGFDAIWYGACADDHADYPDCRPDFVASIDRCLATLVPGSLARTEQPVYVSAPFVRMTKVQILRRAKELGVDVASTWSCYTPDGDDPCGTCNSCRVRDAALATVAAEST